MAETKPDGSYVFTSGGKSYTLKPIDEEATAMRVPARVTQQALMHPDDQMRQASLAMHVLDSSGQDEKVMDALMSLTTGEMMEIIQEWMGESSGSSE
jgi:hypothetical protein